jgi:hypothetical protein
LFVSIGGKKNSESKKALGAYRFSVPRSPSSDVLQPSIIIKKNSPRRKQRTERELGAQKPRATRNGKFTRAELQRSKSASSKTTTSSKEEKIREEEEATRPIDDRDDGDGENC